MSDREQVVIDIKLDSQKLSDGVQQAITRIDELERELQNLQNTGNTTGNTVTDSTAQMASGFKTLGNVGKKMTAMITLPLVGFATASVKTASEFEYAMSEVQAISGATGNSLKMLEEKAKELGETTFYSATEASEGMKYFALN